MRPLGAVRARADEAHDRHGRKCLDLEGSLNMTRGHAVFGADGEPEVGLAGDGVHAADPGYLALAWSLSVGDKVGTVTAYVHGGSGIENDETVSSCKAGSAVGVAPVNGMPRSVATR